MKRPACLTALALFLVSSVAAQEWAQAIVDQSPRHLEWMTVKSGAREVGCYLGYPEVKEKATAVVVIHDIWGLSAWARLMVDDLAAAGYIALAPDLLWGADGKAGGTSELTSERIPLALRALPREQITADLSAAVAYAAKLPACNGKVVVVGFCWGGSESFRFATNNTALKAAFVFYGEGPAEEAAIARIACPVVGFYAENDARINATIPATAERMKAAGKVYEPIFYEGAGHGFMKTGRAPPAATRTSASDEANHRARGEAWQRLLAWLGKI